jgi:hypothetical protein
MNIALIILLDLFSITVSFFTETTNCSCGGAIWKIFKHQTIRFTFKIPLIDRIGRESKTTTRCNH